MGYPNTTGTATEQSRRSKVLPGIPFDLPCARRHAELWASLEAEGKRIGAHDMIIAATGLRFGLEVATLNKSEFARVALPETPKRSRLFENLLRPRRDRSNLPP